MEKEQKYKSITPTLFLFLLVFGLTAAEVYSFGRVPETIIRVAVMRDAERVNIGNDSDFNIIDVKSGRRKRLSARICEVQAVPEGMKIEGAEFGDFVRFVSQSDGFMRVNERQYRDTLLLRNDGGRITVINEVGLDSYLYGVLPVEVSPGWPIEALKAQAVVSRTYVLNNLGKYGESGYDLSDDVFSQVYRGADVEAPKTNQAVNETAGKVLSSGGEIKRVYFFSCCGGYTEDISDVWGSNITHMEGVVCRYCTNSPRFHWEVHITPGDLEERLNRAGYGIGNVKNIKPAGRTNSGRVDELRIKHSGGVLKTTGHRFRMAVGPDVIKSAMFSVRDSEPDFSFHGRGWGHGVGMCQWGAKGQAQNGKGFREILDFYFPGMDVEKWSY